MICLRHLGCLCLPALAGAALAWAQSTAVAQPAAEAPAGEATAAKTASLTLADGALTVDAPTAWKQVKPRNRIIEMELAIPGVTADATGGRLTVMAAGGSIQANIARWAGQFRSGADGKPKTETTTESLGGMKLTLFDGAGTYLDSPRGPFGPKVEKADYRMVAAILETSGSGNYFFKLVGPKSVIDGHADAFRQMIRSVEKSVAGATQ